MSFPAGFGTRHFYPDIAIWNRASQNYNHVFRHDAIGGTPMGSNVRNPIVLKPHSYSIRRGINSDAGECDIICVDHDNE